MTLSKLSRDDWIIAGLALLLAIDLLFLPWWSATAGFGPFTVSVSQPATSAPDGWLGVLGVLTALALLADLVLDRMTTAKLPSIGESRVSLRFVLGGAAAICVLFKSLLHVSFTTKYWDVGFWIAVIAGAALVAMMVRALEAEG